MDKDCLIALKEIFGFKYTCDNVSFEIVGRVAHRINSPVYTREQYRITFMNGYILYGNWVELFRTNNINELLTYIAANLSHLRISQPLQKLAIQDIID